MGVQVSRRKFLASTAAAVAGPLIVPASVLGKGGATAIGILALLMPKAIPLAVGIFILALLLTRYPTFSYGLALLCAPFVAWLGYESGKWVLFSVIILLMVLIRYMPRLLEMRSTGGNWKRVFIRKGLKDRF